MSSQDEVMDTRSATTLPELLHAAAAAYGDDPAVVLRDEALPEETLSFNAWEARSALLARAFLARGIGKGTRVGFIYPNGPAFAVIFAALGRIGAVAVPISTLIRANELVRVLRQSDVHTLIVQRTIIGKDYVERLCEALPALAGGSSPLLALPDAPYLRAIFSTGEGLPATIGDFAALEAGEDAVGADLLAAVEAEVHPTDQLVEIYTSGSMALPKGVKHNHGPTVFRGQFLGRMMVPIQRHAELPAALPMFWVGGLMMYLMPHLVEGAVSVCAERTISNSQMAMGSVLSDDDLAMMSGSPAPWWGLGMSETLGPYTHGDEFRAPGYPVCAPMDNIADRYEVKVVDEDGGETPDGSIGELLVRGYAVTPGLHKIERGDHFTPDGYYRTGDMVLVETRPNGKRRLNFVGRGGDMIKTAGSNVSPAEVEMEMQSIEGVHNAYVVGIPDKERGQLVVAAVVPRTGVTLDYQEIEAELRRRISSYKVPRAYVELSREDVPMLHSNKVARREIARMMAERLERA